MSKVKYLSFFLAGIAVGWLAKPSDEDPTYHGRSSPNIADSQSSQLNWRIEDSTDSGSLPVAQNHSRGHDTSFESPVDNEEPQNQSSDYSFKELLDLGRYQQALTLLQEAESDPQTNEKTFRSILLDHLRLLLEQDRNNDFISLTDLYLASYFEDIDVLLLLAEFNKGANLYIEAVGIYQLATEYAYSLKTQQKVEGALDTFLRETDAFLSQQEDWYNLSQVFLQAEIVGLLRPKYRLRQAEVYLINGDVYEATQILNSLLNDTQFSQRAKDLLAHIDGGSGQIANDSFSQNHASSLALENHGNQYIADLNLSDTVTTRLLIDTGASLTTLSLSAFDRIRGQIRYDYAGDRMFSTANGLIRGQVYNVDVVTIANFRLENTNIAVLDFGMNGGIDGLLGMNVLGKFRFQIDQDRSQLLLSPR